MDHKKILVVLPLNERQKKLLEKAFPAGEFIYKDQNYDDLLPDAEIIIGSIPPEKIKLAEKLEWIQLNNAGVERYVPKGIVREGIILTCASGTYGLAIAEYLTACLFSLFKKLNKYHSHQLKHEWHDEGDVFSVYGSRTLVVGTGDIGSEFGQRMHLLGSKVYGIRKHMGEKPDWAEEIHPMSDLDDQLKEADIVALTLPKTKETEHVINMERLKLMKKTAVLLNIGRGSAIVTDDLCEALNKRIIFGAAVDVTDPEPLPPDHPLWDAENIIITPHVAGDHHLPETFERIIRLSARNLEAFAKGKEMESVVDFEAGYRKYRG